MKLIIKAFILIHVIFWTLFSVYVYWESAVENGPPFRNNSLIGLILTGVLVFYCHFFILTKYLNKKKYKVYFLGLIGILLVGPLPFLLFLQQEKLSSWLHFLVYYGAVMGTVVLVFIILSALARVTQNLIINTLKKEQLEKQAVQAELYYLKSQINPHFLFNTLNNIHTLVYKQAATAPEAVQRLASLMRYMIYESNAVTVPVSREITYLQDYIALQQLRYRKIPVVKLQVEGDPASCQIAPLLLIHLLENAYKHSPARLEPEDIKVVIEVKKDSLKLSIQNPIEHYKNNLLEEPGGVGLPNVQKRLQLLYPEQHELVIHRSGDMFAITLKIHNLHLQANDKETHLFHH